MCHTQGSPFDYDMVLGYGYLSVMHRYFKIITSVVFHEQISLPILMFLGFIVVVIIVLFCSWFCWPKKDDQKVLNAKSILESDSGLILLLNVLIKN